MHDWLGFALIPVWLGVLAAGFAKRRSRQRTVLPAGAIRPEFAAMGEIVRPLILFVVGVFALKISLFYFVFGGQTYLTPLDFSGILLILAAYAVYVVLATTRLRSVPEPLATELRPAE